MSIKVGCRIRDVMSHNTDTRSKPNRTPSGELACAFGTPWLDHLSPPAGTGRGCLACDTDGRKTRPEPEQRTFAYKESL